MSKVWLITGSGNGLGRDTAEAALAAGDSVVAGARRTAELTPLVDGWPGLWSWGAPSLTFFKGGALELACQVWGGRKSPALQNAKDGAPQVLLQRLDHPPGFD